MFFPLILKKSDIINLSLCFLLASQKKDAVFKTQHRSLLLTDGTLSADTRKEPMSLDTCISFIPDIVPTLLMVSWNKPGIAGEKRKWLLMYMIGYPLLLIVAHLLCCGYTLVVKKLNQQALCPLLQIHLKSSPLECHVLGNLLLSAT